MVGFKSSQRLKNPLKWVGVLMRVAGHGGSNHRLYSENPLKWVDRVWGEYWALMLKTSGFILVYWVKLSYMKEPLSSATDA